MAPSISPLAKQVLSAAQLAPVPGIAPALEALKTAIDLYNGIQSNRGACAALIERSADLLHKVTQAFHDAQGESMKTAIDLVQNCLFNVQHTIELASKHNWVYWLFHQDDISESIARSETSIEDAFRVLGVKADVAIYNLVHDMKTSQEVQHNEIIANLNAEPQVMVGNLELRTAIRRLLLEYPQDRESRSQALHQALSSLLGSSQTDADLPPYVITSYEISKDTICHRGVYSTVWKGRWQNCHVAVKELTKEVSREDLERQVAIWSGLRHENILQFYGVSTFSDVPFLVSPFMENGTVMDFLRAANPSTNRLHFIKGVASGMQYLHSRNFIHGNLQGENVLVNASGNACLSGFGLAKIKHDALSKSTDEAFKKRNSNSQRPWMSPERFLGKSTRKTDVWAFAMTTHEILSGRPPFEGFDPAAIRKHIISSATVPAISHLPPPSDEAIIAGYSEGIRLILGKLLVYDTVSRPSFETINVMLSIL